MCATKKQGNLLMGLASKLTPTSEKEKLKLSEYISNDKISSNAELEKALIFVKNESMKKGGMDWSSFESHMGMNK